MKATVLLLLVFGMAACAGAPPPPASPPSTGVTSNQGADDPGRSLGISECESLGQWVAEACANRPNERSAHVDGWCSDVLSGVSSGSWVHGDCMKNIKYMDSVCFRSAANVHNMMACDESVHRP